MRFRSACLVALLSGTAAVPAYAETGSDAETSSDAAATADSAPAPAPTPKAFTTGVAKGRDLLDTAISASTLDEHDLASLSVSSIAGIMQNIPGIRSETSDIDGFSAITIRGLPLAAEGSKFLQLQEDGLPVLEFGDIQFAGIDQFLRADLTLSQVQAIRGGSASTFASNSPGGLINFISRTGETAGGLMQVSSGLGHDLKRIDFAYGSPLGDGWRFHVGGFYRTGEGPREIGYTGFKGGQFKANVTKDFDGGYIRFYAKYLDDQQPIYGTAPVTITGTDADPQIGFLPGFDIRENGYASPLTASYAEVDRNNNPTLIDGRDGLAAQVKSFGIEAQFDIAGWSVTNRFRFSDVSGEYNDNTPFVTAPAPFFAGFGGPGASLSYAAGPQAGSAITDARLLALSARIYADLESLDNVTNDLRATRVWDAGDGKLTTTAGLYSARQDIAMFWNFTSTLQDIQGGGQSAPVNLTAGNGLRLTDGGTLAYGFAVGLPFGIYHNRYDVDYDIVAPYGSVNYQIGKLAIGASLRWDKGQVNGQVFSANFGGGRVGVAPIDVNRDGQVSVAESRVAILPLTQPAPVDYDYDYLSYSAGVNYRFADSLSAFARYSRGGRASAENAIGTETLNPLTGRPTDPAVQVSVVKQAEAGVKFRKDGLSAFLTGFWASTDERNFQITANASGQAFVVPVNRTYSAKGLEFEGEWRKGPFAITVGATFTDASIDKDANNPAFDGNTPRHIPDFAFFARPEVALDKVTFGAVINGTTKSFAQDTNQLVQPGYVLVSPYVQYRPADGLTVALNAFNVFDELAVVQIGAPTIPASGIANVQVMNGRTVTASLRYAF
ncbi:TonB-dependent receptor domain-containing protein [Erythrobacter sp. BLCC-B19]|uniref:TonB-dependent receptor domain-containing protein n=1 Tax=Erythrobacter sp. BLCC-B19 TaxID=3025315 RepID=UPI002362F4DE|nr:TonB-dependent receptor [Erythrobacter sp. BLCC-B19]WDA40186.1 TonB-dependent receptor [Erythrobacter sp. BLCC-B19]